MLSRFRIRRVRWLVLAVLLGLMGVVVPAGTRGQAQVHPTPVRPVLPITARFAGLVTSVSGPSASPTSFTLETKARPIDLRVAPAAVFTPKSAEAEVEGFMVGDYAVVNARRINRTWVAEQISFDVRPVKHPRDITVTGSVLRVAVNGKHFEIALDSGGSRWVAINATTQFRLDGQLVFNPPPLSKGERVTVVMRSTLSGWVAVEVNLRTSSGQYRR